MTSAPYCCGEIKASDKEDDCNIDEVEGNDRNIDRVEEDEEDETIIQFMIPLAPEFKDVSREAHATCHMQ